MSKLTRTKQGKFSINDCINIEDINENSLIDIKDILDIKKVIVDENLKFKIINGQLLDNIYNTDKILFINNNQVLAIYKTYEKDIKKIKPYIMLFKK